MKTIFTIIVVLFSFMSAAWADFNIFSSDIDGKNHKVLITDKTRQMSHPRVSPDGKYILFTRYNNTGGDNLAEELDGYNNTEICMANIDGTNIKVLIPPREYSMNCNASWVPKGFIWVSSTNEHGIPWIVFCNTSNNAISRVNTPLDQIALDPAMQGSKVAYSSIGHSNGIWLLDGKATRLTVSPSLDADPLFAPNGRNLAFIRQFGGDFHIMRYNFQSKKITDLSKDKSDTVPGWSADSKTLVFFHINLQDFSKMGMYKIDATGYNRTMLPLKRGYIYNQPSFFPGSNSKIIYQGFDVKGLN